MSYPFQDDTDYPRMTPAVQWLLIATVAVAFVQVTIVSPADMQRALGASIAGLLGEGRLWTVGTYMFVHAGFWHLALNMYTLFLFGPRVEHAWGRGDERRNFITYYLLCGLGGLLFFLLFDRGGLLVGASAAVMGVMLAYAMHWPDEEMLLFFVVPVKVKWLVVGLALLNMVSAVSSAGGGDGGTAWTAHLGGLAFGWLLLHRPAAMGRWREGIAAAPDTPDETPRAIPRSGARPRERQTEADEAVARSKAVATRKATPAVRALTPAGSRNPELDRVLDKISERGLESLSAAERLLLEEWSKKLRESGR